MMEKDTDSVLVTGGAGYIGGQTVLGLLDAGFRVCVLDDLSTGRLCPFHEQTAFYKGKIHDKALIQKIISTHNVQAILHFAGSIQVAESVSNPLKYYENNTEGSRLLIEAACDGGVETFIFSSTAAVYGEVQGDDPVCETAATEPLNPYGWSKLFTERLLEDMSAAHGMRYGILRYFNVAGADPEGRHGQYLAGPVHLIGRAIDAMLGKVPRLQVFGHDLPTRDGTGIRDYIHVYDLANAHVALLQYLQASNQNALFNLGYGTGHSVKEVIECLENESGRPVPHEYVAPRIGDAPAVVANVESVTRELAWTPKYNNLPDILRSALSWAERTANPAFKVEGRD